MNLLYVNEPFKSIYNRMIAANPKHTAKLYYYDTDQLDDGRSRICCNISRSVWVVLAVSGRLREGKFAGVFVCRAKL